mmetsp:Transcript_25689/g.48720  ORF Transcript_25689/g.48720 Transcript_25689/m.48720 type:complete len:214 (+) Transcript_25689:220-861(+)|eukprot:CAMPEP_0114226922 /NCGR_PEP_ID=MMETSP0058-20121206/1503_1 /TAXON_ID=36894 /ORGANISM="Pyramimonas parkeae, CCMP726" /LENGTH=213 /DNA_ID=CAMNT_0001337705 /DNA_START=170 /DNA_END=811 /DNA_ORIENTATION=+
MEVRDGLAHSKILPLLRHFYEVTVGDKRQTLSTLLSSLSSDSQQYSVVICCRGRDTLEEVVVEVEHILEQLPPINDQVFVLHSDMDNAACEGVIKTFHESKTTSSGLTVLLLTDVCLQAGAFQRLPLAFPDFIINFEMPSTGKMYMQRCLSLLGKTQRSAGKLVKSNNLQIHAVITFVDPGSDVLMLRTIESTIGAELAELLDLHKSLHLVLE